MRILIVCSESPYPANHGGRLDVLQKIKAFVELDYEIDILFICSNKDDDMIAEQYLQKYVKNVYKVVRHKGLLTFILSLLTLVPYQIMSRKELNRINIGKNYDILLLESEYVYKVLSNKSINASRKILRIHNNEVKYFKALMYSAKGLSKIYYFIESKLFLLRKNMIYRQFNDLWFISSNEMLTEYKNAYWLPPNMPVNQPFNFKKFRENFGNLLFVGNLFTPNNIEAIIWFLDNILAKLILNYPNIKFTIAGSVKDNINKTLLDSININSKNIQLIVNPTDDELLNIYNQNTIFINSMLNGAGVKLKTIDAMRNSFAVISTSVGVEGIGLIPNQHFKLANTPQEFIDHIDFLMQQPNKAEEIAEFAYQYINDSFNMKNKILEYSRNNEKKNVKN